MPAEFVILDYSPHGNSADAKSNRLLVEVATWLGHRAAIVDAREWMAAGGCAPLPVVPPPAWVIPRADLRTRIELGRFAELLRALARGGARLLLDAEGLLAAEDKVRTHAAFARAGLPSVPALIVRAGAPAVELGPAAATLGGFPLVRKDPIGWGGLGVVRHEDLAALTVDFANRARLHAGEPLLLQPFVPHAASATLLYVDGRLVSAWRSQPPAGEFRSNPRFGGPTAKFAPATELVDLGKRAVASCGLRAGSVDLLETAAGPRLLEVNAMPGLWPQATGDRHFAEELIRAAGGPDPVHRRVLVVAPFALATGRGNSVSTLRMVEALRAEGLAVDVLESARDAAPVPAAARARPDLVHAIHALHAGPTAARLAREHACPLVVSFRGTDADVYLDEPAHREAIAACVAAAAAVTVLTKAQAERLERELDGVGARLLVVPHGVRVALQRVTRAELGLPEQAPLLVQVAGVRRIKGFPECLDLVDRVRARVPGLQFALVGPLLEADLEPGLRTWLAARRWARWTGEAGHDQSLRWLAAADVTLHASTREGLSNALLEAMALGRPVVARDIAAARGVVTEGADGLLYGDEAEGAEAVASLLSDPARARALGEQARRRVAADFPIRAETEGYLAAYRRALLLSKPPPRTTGLSAGPDRGP
jgi:glycosyltransferase involved in cell wall biosynthesis/glutathione synthase/RimK-type ligase-like ATP-grasp enzyme